MEKVHPKISLPFVLSFVFAMPAVADVPAPPVNQTIGIPDGIFNDLVEAECRFCHEDPDIASGGAHIPNRHHNLMYSPIQAGECSVVRNSCLSNNDCDPGLCSRTNTPCTVDADCPQAAYGEVCGEICIGETVAPDIDSDSDGANDTVYQCLNCHLEDTTGGVVTLLVWRDCLQCHVQIPGDASVHHLTATAQGTDSPLGDPAIGDCTPCHGSVVDDAGDGHAIPTYEPSLVTPATSGGDGAPANSYGNGAGACDYCHDQDVAPPAAPLAVYANDTTHHNTGVFQDEVGVIDDTKCSWCHGFTGPVLDIRVCENCHGYESLHNIALDSDTGCLFGDPGCEVVIGGEAPGYSHVGNDQDCWGCHGFAQASAPGAGPATPYIDGTDVLGITTGADAIMTLSGSALTNLVGSFQWNSDITLTSQDGTTTTLTPDSVTSNQLIVTLPATIAPGNYAVRANKGTYGESNPLVIAVMPEVVITGDSCNKKQGVITITGSGFGEKPAGTDAYINVQIDGQLADVISWSDTEITASVNKCANVTTITVNALAGSASTSKGGDSGGGKPPKPCKGAKCDK